MHAWLCSAGEAIAGQILELVLHLATKHQVAIKRVLASIPLTPQMSVAQDASPIKYSVHRSDGPDPCVKGDRQYARTREDGGLWQRKRQSRLERVKQRVGKSEQGSKDDLAGRETRDMFEIIHKLVPACMCQRKATTRPGLLVHICQHT